MSSSGISELFNVVLHAPASAVREFVLGGCGGGGVHVDSANDKGDTALLLAARRGDIDVVAALLDRPIGANVHARNLKGSNALIAAAMKGFAPICRLLLAHGADVNQSTDSSDTALSLAIWQNHTDVCLLLMQAGARVDNVDQFGDSMLLDAAKHGNVAVMHSVLEAAPQLLDHTNKRGDSALIRAALKGELNALNLLLDHGANATLVNKIGSTALLMACMHNNRACAKRLIECDTSPINAVDDTGRSAFAYLALYPSVSPGTSAPVEEPYWEGMQLLLERDARIDTPANVGNLLLCRAANINQIALADLLLQAGADINFCDPVNKERPALLAHLQGAPDFNCTQFLVQHAAKVDYQDTDGHTGLMFAIKHNSPEIAGFLLDNGASTTLENKAGETPASMCMQMMHNFQTHIAQLQLMAASDPEHPPPALALHQLSLERAQQCLALLMERSAREMGSGALLLQAAQHGDLDALASYLTLGVCEVGAQQPTAIDVNFTDKAGRSALMLAAKSNHLHCVKHLLQHGALINLRDKDGVTALTLAIRSGSRECAEALAETIQGHSVSNRGAFHYHFASGSGGRGVSGSGSGGPSAQVFGLACTPQQMAQEEFDASTNFLLQVADQLRLYLLHGKQAAHDAVQLGKSPQPGGTEIVMKPLSTSVSSPLCLNSPLTSTRSPNIATGSYALNSFPSPAASPSSQPSQRMQLDPLPAIAASPRHGDLDLGSSSDELTPRSKSSSTSDSTALPALPMPPTDDDISLSLVHPNQSSSTFHFEALPAPSSGEHFGFSPVDPAANFPPFVPTLPSQLAQQTAR